jgi:outer membrane protein assembly factor BamB
VRLALFAVLAVVTTACQVDWPTWGNGVERVGANGAESTLSPSNVNGLRELWSADLGAYANSSPVLARQIDVNGTPTDLLYVGNEHGVLFAVSTEGQYVWFRALGSRTQPQCLSTPDGVHGVAAAAVVDRSRDRVYAADGDGKVWAFNPATGATVPGWPVTISTDGLH